jgi:hypothetical protein
MVPLQEPTPLPLPSPKKGSFSEAEQQQEKKLHIAAVEAATDPPVIVDNHSEEVEHKEESLVAADAEQEGINSSNGDHSEEGEVWNEEHFGSPAAEATVTTIEQRFGGLVVCEQQWYFNLPSSSQFLFDLTGGGVQQTRRKTAGILFYLLWLLLLGWVETTGSESAGQAPSPGPWAYSEEAATTLRTIQALVRVQALIRGHQVRLSKEGQGVQDRLLQHRQLSSRPNKVSVCLSYPF